MSGHLRGITSVWFPCATHGLFRANLDVGCVIALDDRGDFTQLRFRGVLDFKNGCCLRAGVDMSN